MKTTRRLAGMAADRRCGRRTCLRAGYRVRQDQAAADADMGYCWFPEVINELLDSAPAASISDGVKVYYSRYTVQAGWRSQTIRLD